MRKIFVIIVACCFCCCNLYSQNLFSYIYDPDTTNSIYYKIDIMTDQKGISFEKITDNRGVAPYLLYDVLANNADYRIFSNVPDSFPVINPDDSVFIHVLSKEKDLSMCSFKSNKAAYILVGDSTTRTGDLLTFGYGINNTIVMSFRKYKEEVFKRHPVSAVTVCFLIEDIMYDDNGYEVPISVNEWSIFFKLLP